MSTMEAFTVLLAFSAMVLGTAAMLLPRVWGLAICGVMAFGGASVAFLGNMLETEAWHFVNPAEDLHPLVLFGSVIGLAGLAGLPAVWIAKRYFPPVTTGTATVILLVLCLVPALLWIFSPKVFL